MQMSISNSTVMVNSALGDLWHSEGWW